MISDDSILGKLRSFEDSYVERKSRNDLKDITKTVVAFANSTPIGYPALLFIGVLDDGIVEAGNDCESLQKTLNREAQKAYPSVYYLVRVLGDVGRQFVAVIIPGSEQRPHFAGPSCIRVGTESKVASEAQFNSLIAERQSKAHWILGLKSKPVHVDFMNPLIAVPSLGLVQTTGRFTVVDCNQFYVTLQNRGSSEVGCYPLDRIRISFDTKSHVDVLEVSAI